MGCRRSRHGERNVSKRVCEEWHDGDQCGLSTVSSWDIQSFTRILSSIRAPEHQFPTALNDGYDVYRWVTTFPFLLS